MIAGSGARRGTGPADGAPTTEEGEGIGGSRLLGGKGPLSPHFHEASELIGKRWTGAIIRSLFHGVSRFREIADAVPGLSDRMLALRLKELERNDIVEPLEDRAGYRLTPKGHDLRMVLIEVAKWADRWQRE